MLTVGEQLFLIPRTAFNLPLPLKKSGWMVTRKQNTRAYTSAKTIILLRRHGFAYTYIMPPPPPAEQSLSKEWE
jgi:hypothetical protein